MSTPNSEFMPDFEVIKRTIRERHIEQLGGLNSVVTWTTPLAQSHSQRIFTKDDETLEIGFVVDGVQAWAQVSIESRQIQALLTAIHDVFDITEEAVPLKDIE
ncbi:hypothetical protein BYT27DRAFT_7244313 [Phlegmacium glaucopus]|nr:hypothetical protein BYT27DRAFT_7244313 [Phlegmacium glaucopus]